MDIITKILMNLTYYLIGFNTIELDCAYFSKILKVKNGHYFFCMKDGAKA
jgi:hypothetical protein